MLETANVGEHHTGNLVLLGQARCCSPCLDSIYTALVCAGSFPGRAPAPGKAKQQRTCLGAGCARRRARRRTPARCGRAGRAPRWTRPRPAAPPAPGASHCPPQTSAQSAPGHPSSAHSHRWAQPRWACCNIAGASAKQACLYVKPQKAGGAPAAPAWHPSQAAPPQPPRSPLTPPASVPAQPSFSACSVPLLGLRAVPPMQHRCPSGTTTHFMGAHRAAVRRPCVSHSAGFQQRAHGRHSAVAAVPRARQQHGVQHLPLNTQAPQRGTFGLLLACPVPSPGKTCSTFFPRSTRPALPNKHVFHLSGQPEPYIKTQRCQRAWRQTSPCSHATAASMGVRPRVLATRHVPGCLVASVYATIGCLVTAGETSLPQPCTQSLTCAQWLAVKKRSCQRYSTCSAPVHCREVQRRVTLGVCWSGLNPWLSQE